MRVFITGASGHIGSPLVAELLSAGHQVVGLARSDASATARQPAGAAVPPGGLPDVAGLTEAPRATGATCMTLPVSPRPLATATAWSTSPSATTR